MMVSNFRHISTYSGIDVSQSTSWKNPISLKTMVCIVRYLYMISLLLLSSMSIIIGQYTIDNLFVWINKGTIYAFQLIPEAKMLVEQMTDNFDRQPFQNNYFSVSIGFCIVFLFSATYMLIITLCGKKNTNALGLKTIFIFIFTLAAISQFIKPQLHLDKHRKFYVDWT